MELRARLRDTPAADFVGAEDGHNQALRQTERDYVALVATGAAASRLETRLETADRQATEREVDTAVLTIRQMREIVDAVASRLPPGDDPR